MDIREMFNDIAPTYDALNHILSLGIDRGWRSRVVCEVTRFLVACSAAGDPAELRDDNSPFSVLDVATGTGDLAIAIARALPDAQVVGVDISEGMLAIGRRKIEKIRRRSLVACSAAGDPAELRDDSQRTNPELRVGDAEDLPFADGAFDCVTAAFGVRNFGDKMRGLREMCRVLKPGGMCLILEFSEPRSAVFGRAYRWYFHRVLPFVGRLVSRNRGAYSYLPRSVGDFPTPEKFGDMVLGAGFSTVEKRSLTGGVAYIYKGKK